MNQPSQPTLQSQTDTPPAGGPVPSGAASRPRQCATARRTPRPRGRSAIWQ
jgi:hypothetical protein